MLILTSYFGCLYLFWYVWKEQSHSYTIWYVSGGSVFKFTTESGNHPLVKRRSEKAW